MTGSCESAHPATCRSRVAGSRSNEIGIRTVGTVVMSFGAPSSVTHSSAILLVFDSRERGDDLQGGRVVGEERVYGDVVSPTSTAS